MSQHGSPAGWGMAVSATLHCLTGCAIGEVLGMVIGTALGLHNAATVVLAIVLAFVFGYGLTMQGVLRAGVPLRQALRIAFAADTASIAVMEIADNAVVVAVPGAMDAGLSSLLFWASLAFSLVVAFVVTVPVNRWMIGRGKGHAVVHHLHHGATPDHETASDRHDHASDHHDHASDHHDHASDHHDHASDHHDHAGH